MENNLVKTCELFVKHAQALEAKKEGCAPQFELSVRLKGYGDKVPAVNLQCHFTDANNNYQTVKAASFSALIEEVWRRLGFSDREALENDRVESALKALPSPADSLEDEL